MPRNFYWNQAIKWFERKPAEVHATYSFDVTVSWMFLLLWARNSKKEKR